MQALISPETIDAPLEVHDIDILKRQDFADTIADTIKNWRSNTGSLVLAITGEWGDGKTSLISLMERNFDDLSKTPKDHKPYLIKFNPWDWASQHKIEKAFFDELSKQLRNNLLINIAKKVKKLGEIFDSGKVVFEEVKSIALYTLAAIGGLHGAKLAFNIQWAEQAKEQILNLLLVASPFLLVARQISSSFRKASNALLAKIGGRTLEETKKELRKELLKLSKPIVVVIDDIDRLTSPEIRQVFQLIKLHSDLPRIIFVLPYSQKVVEKALKDEAFEGREYLEKLVHISLNVPALHPSTLKDYLFDKLKAIFPEEGKVDWNRLQLIYETKQLFRYFTNLRHAKRYLNNLRVHLVHMHFKNATQQLDFNSVDLIVLEVLRVFESAIYNQLPRYKYELTGHDSFSLYRGIISRINKKDGEEISVVANKLLEDSNPDRRHAIKGLLVELFPNLAKGMADKLYSTNNNDLEIRASA